MLKVNNITKFYKLDSFDKKVLDNISFKVDDGEILGITGKSGSGKTTLLKVLRGVESLDEGTIELNGVSINSGSGKEGSKFLIKNTAIHLQRSFGLWNGPAIENVIRKLSYIRTGNESLPEKDSPYYDDMYNEAYKYLKMVKLDQKALHSSSALSGGEKQRLIIARQLASRPSLLLLDEPVTMTGPETKQQVLDVLKELKLKLNIPIIVVSHLPEVHMYLSDRLVFIEDGKLVDDGLPESVLKNYNKDLKPRLDFKVNESKTECIKVNNISKRLVLLRVGEVLNIQNLSLKIKKGEIVSLIGPSGTGKTTLMKIIEGLLEPKTGNVCYNLDGDWVEITKFSKRRMELRQKISIMHQEFSLSPHSTIREQIGFKLSMKKRGSLEYAQMKASELNISEELLDTIYRLPDMSENERAMKMHQLNLSDDIYSKLFPKITNTDLENYSIPIFESLNLPLEILDKKPHHISGGEHVRAYIATALATYPDILFLDEPFGDLDPVTLRDVTNALKSINKDFGTTIIFVSHHIDFVKEAANRAILILDGEIANDGKPSDVCQDFIDRSNVKYLN